MATHGAAQGMGPTVWTAMNYTPPRGKCNFKNGLMAGTCPCLRFMLHPVKAATSFECDGCAHHASYHNMDNPEEEAVMKRWTDRETALVPYGSRGSDAGGVSVTGAGSKRKRVNGPSNGS